MSDQKEPKMNVEEAFNTIVNLVRQSKLNWEEHRMVDVAVNTVLDELNKKSAPASKEKK
tara:strand:+ start:622 stop:798 length:177 start_codon:yes stop_codon:yes gene_type:complete